MSTLTNLIAYWRMDEIGGIRYDSVGNWRLDLDGTPNYSTGHLGSRCLAFDSTGDGVHTAGTLPADFSAAAVSFAGWVRIATTSGSGLHTLATLETTDSGETAYRTLTLSYNAATNQIQVATSPSGFSHAASDYGALSTGVWHHVIVTWVGSTVTVYVNNLGTSNSGHATMAGFYVPSVVSFGTATSVLHLFDVDDWGVWNEELSATDRSDLYNFGSGAIPPGLGYLSGGQVSFFGFH